MLLRIILVILIVALEAGAGYYSFVINGSLFSRFLFFLLTTGIVCLLVVKGIRYILPGESYHHEDEKNA